MVVPVLAAKRVSGPNAALIGDATKPLTGDIYVRRWTTKGKGKKKGIPIEHEVRVNAVTAAVVAVGAAATVAGAAVALWMMQLRIHPRTIVKPAWTEQRLHPEIPHYELKHYDGYWEYRFAPSYISTDPETKGQWMPGKELPPIWHAPYDEWTSKAAWTETIYHPEGEDGKQIKKYSIEKRQPFSMADVLPDPLDALGLGEPVFGPWLKGQFWAKKKK